MSVSQITFSSRIHTKTSFPSSNVNTAIELIFLFGRFGIICLIIRYFHVVPRLELTVLLWTGLPTSFTLGWASWKVEVMKNTSTFYQPDWLPSSEICFIETVPCCYPLLVYFGKTLFLSLVNHLALVELRSYINMFTVHYNL